MNDSPLEVPININHQSDLLKVNNSGYTSAIYYRDIYTYYPIVSRYLLQRVTYDTGYANVVNEIDTRCLLGSAKYSCRKLST